MKKILIKSFCSIIIINIIFTTITITATYNFEKEKQIEEYDLKTKNINQKIKDSLAMINETMLKEYLTELVSYGSRVTGTYSCEKAAEYLYKQFEKMGLECKYQNWSVHNNKKIPLLYNGQNVIAIQKGINDSIEGDLILNAHYDAVKYSPGANDDGSGTVAVLAAAYVLSQLKFNRTIKYILFSGEEQGLLGSHEYAKKMYENNEKILVAMNADMIGHTKTADGGRKYRIYATNDVVWMMDEIDTLNQEYNINLEMLKGVTTLEGGGGSDYVNFLRYGYDTLAFFQAEIIVKYWHTALDLVENVNLSYLVNTTKCITSVLAHLADYKDEVNPKIKIASPKRGFLYFDDRIIREFEKFETKIINDVVIYAEVEKGTSSINRVEFYYNDKLIYTDTGAPYHFRLNKISLSEKKIEVIVYDESGNTANDEMNILYLNLLRRK